MEVLGASHRLEVFGSVEEVVGAGEYLWVREPVFGLGAVLDGATLEFSWCGENSSGVGTSSSLGSGSICSRYFY